MGWITWVFAKCHKCTPVSVAVNKTTRYARFAINNNTFFPGIWCLFFKDFQHECQITIQTWLHSADFLKRELLECVFFCFVCNYCFLFHSFSRTFVINCCCYGFVRIDVYFTVPISMTTNQIVCFYFDFRFSLFLFFLIFSYGFKVWFLLHF